LDFQKLYEQESRHIVASIENKQEQSELIAQLVYDAELETYPYMTRLLLMRAGLTQDIVKHSEEQDLCYEALWAL